MSAHEAVLSKAHCPVCLTPITSQRRGAVSVVQVLPDTREEVSNILYFCLLEIQEHRVPLVVGRFSPFSGHSQLTWTVVALFAVRFIKKSGRPVNKCMCILINVRSCVPGSSGIFLVAVA